MISSTINLLPECFSDMIKEKSKLRKNFLHLGKIKWIKKQPCTRLHSQSSPKIISGLRIIENKNFKDTRIQLNLGSIIAKMEEK